MKNNTIITKYLFFGMALALIGFTAPLDFAFVARVLPDRPEMAWFSLVLFDLGMFGWLQVYLHLATGHVQRGISSTMTIFSLLGVFMLAAGEILWEGQEFIHLDISKLPFTVIIILVVWVLINLLAYMAFHISDPEIQKQNQISQIRSEVFDAGMAAVKKQKGTIAAKLSKLVTETVILNTVKDINEEYGETDTEYELVKHKKGYQKRRKKKKAGKKSARSVRRDKQRAREQANDIAVFPLANDDGDKEDTRIKSGGRDPQW